MIDYFQGNLTQTIVEELGRDIATEKIPAGCALANEAELCERFNASRTVIREAVKMLTAKGLLKARPKLGTLVMPEAEWNLSDPNILRWLLGRPNSLELIDEFIELRMGIEPMAAYLAASRRDQADLQSIEACLDALADPNTDPLTSDINFHIAILKASHNRFYWNMRHTIEQALRHCIRLTNRFKGVEKASVNDHYSIFASIERGDAESARYATSQLITEAKILLNQHLSKNASYTKETKKDSREIAS